MKQYNDLNDDDLDKLEERSLNKRLNDLTRDMALLQAELRLLKNKVNLLESNPANSALSDLPPAPKIQNKDK